MDTNETKDGTNRRNFLGTIATGAAAIGLTSIAPSLTAFAGEAKFDPKVYGDPVDSEAKLGMATGRQIWDWMENELENAFAKDPKERFGGWVIRFKGMEVNFTIEKQEGKRVNWIKVNKEPIDHLKQYSFVACEREGDPDTTLCRMEGVKEPKKMGATLHSVIEEYLKEFSPISPKVEGRCTATDAPHDLLTQVMGVGYEFK